MWPLSNNKPSLFVAGKTLAEWESLLGKTFNLRHPWDLLDLNAELIATITNWPGHPNIQLGDDAAARRQFAALRTCYPTLKARLLADEAEIWRNHERLVEARAAYLAARVAFMSLPSSRRSQPAFLALGQRIDEALDSLEKPLNSTSK